MNQIIVNGRVAVITSRQRQRFFQRFSGEFDGECWLWTGATSRDGYGRMAIGSEGRDFVGAHRLAFVIFREQDPKELEVCHSCDTPLCVNPKHLFLGTKSDNMRDCAAKGRNARMLGEKNGKTNLTTDRVLLIRARYANGEAIKKIARDECLNDKTVRDIVKRRRWAHI